MKWKKCLVPVLAAVLSAGMLCGCQIGNKEIIIATQMGKDDIFRLNDEKASMSEAYVFLSEYKNVYGTVYGVDLWESGAANADMERYVKRLALSSMAKAYTLDMLADSQGVTLTEDEKRYAEEVAEIYYDSLNKDQADKLGISQDTVLTVCNHYALAQKLFQSLTEGVDVEISDDAARVMEVQQIYVTSEDTANEIEAALAEGKDFSSLASFNEADVFDLTITRTDIDPAAEAEVYALENGQTTGKIACEDGFYFYKCINYYDEAKTAANKEAMENDRLDEALDESYTAFKEALDSEVNSEGWRDVTIADCTVDTDQSFFALYDEIFGIE